MFAVMTHWPILHLLVQVLGCGLAWLRTSSLMESDGELQLMSSYSIRDDMHHNHTLAGVGVHALCPIKAWNCREHPVHPACRGVTAIALAMQDRQYRGAGGEGIVRHQ